MPRPSRLIGIEEHFVIDGYEHNSPAPGARALLEDIDGKRLQEMDRCGVDMQVLSLTAPGVQNEPDAAKATQMAKRANDELAKIIQRHPKRFAGFAAIACQDPKSAADELERAVKQLGLVGALVNNSTLGRYLDEDAFSPIWERAQALDVPLYIHPANPPVRWAVTEGYPGLDGAMWGWAAETGAHALRLVLGGVFERFPRAKLILGHMGEGLPFFLWRLDSRYVRQPPKVKLANPPSYYVRENIYITTSGVFAEPPLMCAIAAMGIGHVLFAVDWPLEVMEQATKWLREANLHQDQVERIAHTNIEQLLKL